MYTVKQAAEIMNLSAHTLRFYAKSNMFPFITRDYNNIRQFSDKDLEWVKLVKCLRDTGMPIEEIKRYIELCKIGDSTIKERYRMILEQKDKAKAQMNELQKSIDLLSYKAERYSSFLKGEKDMCNPATASISIKEEKRTVSKRMKMQRKPMIKVKSIQKKY